VTRLTKAGELPPRTKTLVGGKSKSGGKSATKPKAAKKAKRGGRR
jgi:hypothetical protein